MCAHLASVGSRVHGQSSFIGGGLSSSRGRALSFVSWALFVPFIGAGSLLVGIWVLYVSGGGLLHAAHIVHHGGLMFMGSSCGLGVLSGVCGCWVIVRGCCRLWAPGCHLYQASAFADQKQKPKLDLGIA